MVTAASHWDHSLEALDYLSVGEKQFRILQDFQNQTYVRTAAGWRLDGKPYTFQPVVGRLDNELLARLTAEERDEIDPADLVRRAWFGQAFRQYDRVVALATRALRSVIQPPDPRHAGAVVPDCWRSEAVAAAAMLCSALRELHESQRAIDDTSVFDDGKYSPLMTSRAAALCDVGRWDEGHALAVAARGINDSDAVRLLFRRLDAHFAQETSRTR